MKPATRAPGALVRLVPSVLLLLLFLLFPLALHAQTDGDSPKKKLTVAVMDLTMSGGIPEVYQETLSDRLRLEMHNSGAFNVVERKAMEDILSEQGLQLSGCTSNECAVEVGRLLGVEAIVAGSIGRVGNAHSIILRMIDVEKGLIIKSKNVDCSCPIEEVMSSRLREAAELLADMEPSRQPRELARRGGQGVEGAGHPLPRSLLVPGWGQIATGRKAAGWTYLAAEVLALGVVGITIADYNERLNDYHDSRNAYENANSALEAAQRYDDKITRYDDLERVHEELLLFGGIAGGIYLWNVVDALVFGPANDRAEDYALGGSRMGGTRVSLAPSINPTGSPMVGLSLTWPAARAGGER